MASRNRSAWMSKEFITELRRHKNNIYKRWRMWPRRYTEYLSDLAGIALGKPKLTLSWIWEGMWRATKNFINTSAAKGRLEQMWVHCWMGLGSWWQITWMKYSVLPLPQVLPVGPAFRYLWTLRPMGKCYLNFQCCLFLLSFWGSIQDISSSVFFPPPVAKISLLQSDLNDSSGCILHFPDF